MAATKRTDTEREADLVKIAKLHRKGCSEAKIANIMKLSPGQIHYDIVEIRERYQKQTMHVREMHVNEINAQLDDLLWQHWRCYQKLQSDFKKVVEKQEVIQ